MLWWKNEVHSVLWLEENNEVKPKHGFISIYHNINLLEKKIFWNLQIFILFFFFSAYETSSASVL